MVEQWTWNIPWRRAPFGRDLDELRKIEDLLNDVQMVANAEDRRTWRYNRRVVYSAKEAFKLLVDQNGCL
ncbi:hypothetical protein SLA2020_182860 [Shorea laevis]